MAETRPLLSALGTTFRTPTFCASNFHLRRPVQGMHQQRDPGQEFGEFAGGGEAIHHGHDQVQNDDVGPEFLGLGDGLLAILDVNDLPAAGALEQAAQGYSNRRIVVGNQDSDRHATGQASLDGWRPAGRAVRNV